MTFKQMVLAGAGAAITAVAVVGGVAFAQSPGGADTQTPATPPSQTQPQPQQPGRDGDCPEKGGAQGMGARRSAPTQGADSSF